MRANKFLTKFFSKSKTKNETLEAKDTSNFYYGRIYFPANKDMDNFFEYMKHYLQSVAFSVRKDPREFMDTSPRPNQNNFLEILVQFELDENQFVNLCNEKTSLLNSKTLTQENLKALYKLDSLTLKDVNEKTFTITSTKARLKEFSFSSLDKPSTQAHDLS